MVVFGFSMLMSVLITLILLMKKSLTFCAKSLEENFLAAQLRRYFGEAVLMSFLQKNCIALTDLREQFLHMDSLNTLYIHL